MTPEEETPVQAGATTPGQPEQAPKQLPTAMKPKDMGPHRDEKGRLKKGFNPHDRGIVGGNPHAFHQRRNRMAILQAVTPDIARKLTLQTIDIASNPDVRPADRLKATELLLRYAAGEPTQKHEVEVNTAPPAPAPVDLDATDVAALERIRAKLVKPAPAIEAVAKLVEKSQPAPAVPDSSDEKEAEAG